MLSKELIDDPRQWNLVIETDPAQLTAVAYRQGGERGFILQRIPLDEASLPSATAALEEAIYDNPMLLADFNRVTALVDSRRFTLLPPLTPDATGSFSREDLKLATDALAALFAPLQQERQVLLSSLSPMHATLAFDMPVTLYGFLRRTFHGVVITHPLVPLARYFQVKHSGRPEGKMLVNLRHDRTDIIVLGSQGAPRLVNSYRTSEPLDAFYYIMSAREHCHCSHTDEIILGGDRRLRASLTPLLRRYVRYVMPALFPAAMFQAGRESLSAPFEIIVSPSTL